MDHHCPFIGGPRLVSRQAPAAYQLISPIEAENRIGITDIYDEKHKNPGRVARKINPTKETKVIAIF
jgi:hypothetical protein